jgi:hypothetical protein
VARPRRTALRTEPVGRRAIQRRSVTGRPTRDARGRAVGAPSLVGSRTPSSVDAVVALGENFPCLRRPHSPRTGRPSRRRARRASEPGDRRAGGLLVHPEVSHEADDGRRTPFSQLTGVEAAQGHVHAQRAAGPSAPPGRPASPPGPRRQADDLGPGRSSLGRRGAGRWSLCVVAWPSSGRDGFAT